MPPKELFDDPDARRAVNPLNVELDPRGQGPDAPWHLIESRKPVFDEELVKFTEQTAEGMDGPSEGGEDVDEMFELGGEVGDYAVFILSELARRGSNGSDGALASAQELASYSALNKSLVANLLKDLTRAGFLDSVRNQYNYATLQEVKESLYYYNEEQIAVDIKNYLFALNYELGTTAVCTFTGERLEITARMPFSTA